MGQFSISTLVNLSFDRALRETRHALEEEGFVVITEIHLQAQLAASCATRSSRHLVNLAFVLETPQGALLCFLGFGSWAHTHPIWLGGALAFCAGTFLCIASAD